MFNLERFCEFSENRAPTPAISSNRVKYLASDLRQLQCDYLIICIFIILITSVTTFCGNMLPCLHISQGGLYLIIHSHIIWLYNFTAFKDKLVDHKTKRLFPFSVWQYVYVDNTSEWGLRWASFVTNAWCLVYICLIFCQNISTRSVEISQGITTCCHPHAVQIVLSCLFQLVYHHTNVATFAPEGGRPGNSQWSRVKGLSENFCAACRRISATSMARILQRESVPWR